MATISKQPSGAWKAEVSRQGVRKAQRFATKAAAQAWATKTEADILAGKLTATSSVTVAQAVERYLCDVAPTRQSGALERRRLLALLRYCGWLADLPVCELGTAHMARWRDERLRAVSPASVVREASDLRTLWRHCRAWGYTKANPFADVPMPAEPPPRQRQTSASELRRILRALGYVTLRAPVTAMQQVGWMYLLAQHTALRAGEIERLGRASVDLKRRVITLEQHKTSAQVGKRQVPVTRRAARLLAVLDAAAADAGRDAYWTIDGQMRDALFRKARDRLLIANLRFHDSRADALTRLARRVDVMTLARISGHADLRQLLAAYYRETAASIAARL